MKGKNKKINKHDLVVAEQKRRTVSSTLIPLLLKLGDISQKLISHPTGISLLAWLIGQGGWMIGNNRGSKYAHDFIGLRKLGTAGFTASAVVAPIASPIISGLGAYISKGQENRP